MDEQSACSEFTSHQVRKICKTCRRPMGDHPLSEEDVQNIKQNLRVFEDQPEAKPHVQYAWTPRNCPMNRLDEYFQNFPEDKVPRHKSDGQKSRLKRLIYQMPPSDVSLENCRFVEPESKSELENHIQKLQASSLRVGVVKEWTKGMPIQCPKCLLILEAGELVVTTGEITGQSFHPACFTCFQCQDLLADLLHCSDIDGTAFCLRHFNDNMRKRCHACDELIFSSRYALAGEKFYHKNHLLCFSCDRLLEGNKGLEKESELYCGPCYEERFCSDCIKCQKRIKVENRHITFQDKNWHYDCFTCSKCDVLMADSPFEIVGEEFLCAECYNKDYAPRCGDCNELFESTGKVVKYEEKIYHVPCFKCVDCQEIIGTGSFVPHKGRVYCKACHLRNFGIKCFRCTYSITDDRGIMYNKRPYHEDCFSCHKCTTNIASRPFKTVDDKWYCMKCYGDTFCKKCHACDKPILLGANEDILYSFEDYRWHAGCFICSVCEKSLSDTAFILSEKTLICKACRSESNGKVNDEKIRNTGAKDEQEKTETVTS